MLFRVIKLKHVFFRKKKRLRHAAQTNKTGFHHNLYRNMISLAFGVIENPQGLHRKLSTNVNNQRMLSTNYSWIQRVLIHGYLCLFLFISGQLCVILFIFAYPLLIRCLLTPNTLIYLLPTAYSIGNT